MKLRVIALAGALALGAPAVAAVPGGASRAVAPPAPPLASMPPGEEGALIAYGRAIVRDTPKYAGAYVKAGMSCEACHLDAGAKAHGGSFRGIYALFPQYNKRAKRFIALQDRLAECFLYSMNGTPPPYASREMIALTAYVAFLSRGAPVGEGFSGQGLVKFAPPHAPSAAGGATIFAQRCASCHGADGRGNAAFPPLWGPTSFNAGAGMHRLATMAAFVRYNMPYGGPPNALSAQDAYDVSAFVLAHPRPAFDRTRRIAFPARAAATF